MASRNFQEITRAKVLLLYPSRARQAAAEEILGRYTGDSSNGSFRVRLAALKVAGSDLTELERCIHLALQDYRDVLALAEYPRQLEAGFGASDKTLARQDLAEYEEWLQMDRSDA